MEAKAGALAAKLAAGPTRSYGAIRRSVAYSAEHSFAESLAFEGSMMALTGDTGGSRVIRRHEDRLRLVEIPPEELYDCDTKRALDELKTQTGEP